MLLNDRERAEAVTDVARLILSSGQTARILRVVPGERLYGTDDAEYTEISVIPLELNETPPEELSGKIDALACVLPDADVRGEDRLAADWETYRIQSVEEEHFFGTVTHKNLQLVKLNGR
ncbi:hypothetical protein JWJ90_20405 [Desulfobulbus rhabdoformis]|uniref:hypothetical protein n=1 Tax=Desulfobulbus rhabdoformis TaxID=34032 RepID=UPI0019662118|nr:hypothetical protein [Desulfobulbus rhabdoformis]MBM9616633.1 hypothetical protein [Desulfobulbus rhabdoformis]